MYLGSHFLWLPVIAVTITSKIWSRTVDAKKPKPLSQDTRWIITAFFFLSVPLATYIFSSVVTHSFNQRYTVLVVLGVSLLFGFLVSSLKKPVSRLFTTISLALMIVVVPHLRSSIENSWRPTAINLAEKTPSDALLITLNGGRFVEIAEAAPSLLDRLVLVKSPPGSKDPTNSHQAERWAGIRPELRIMDAATVLASNRCILVLSDPSELYQDNFARVFGEDRRELIAGDRPVLIYRLPSGSNQQSPSCPVIRLEGLRSG